MTNPASRQPDVKRVRSHDLGIEWEDMPSLTHLVGPAGAAGRPEPVWADTLPASLEALKPSVWVRDLLPGLDVNEISEPEVFRAFFDDMRKQAAAGRR